MTQKKNNIFKYKSLMGDLKLALEKIPSPHKMKEKSAIFNCYYWTSALFSINIAKNQHKPTVWQGPEGAFGRGMGGGAMI